MKMTRYVIRSMSTSDFDWRSKEPARPYHIYLLPPEQRRGAYWSHLGAAMTFESPEAAYREGIACLGKGYFDIAPVGNPNWPDFWDIQAMRRRAAA